MGQMDRWSDTGPMFYCFTLDVANVINKPFEYEWRESLPD